MVIMRLRIKIIAISIILLMYKSCILVIAVRGGVPRYGQSLIRGCIAIYKMLEECSCKCV